MGNCITAPFRGNYRNCSGTRAAAGRGAAERDGGCGCGVGSGVAGHGELGGDRMPTGDLCQDFGHGSSRNQAAIGIASGLGSILSKKAAMASAGTL